MEDILKEKATEGAITATSGDEFMFFDRTDDFEDLWSSGEANGASLLSSPRDSSSSLPAPLDNSNNNFTNNSGTSTPFSHLRGTSGHSGGGGGDGGGGRAVGDIGFLLQSAPADALQHVSVVGLSIMEW